MIIKEAISQKEKNEQQFKMNYRGINFNTEIEINNNDDMNKYGYNQTKKNEQDIYQFFSDKQKIIIIQQIAKIIMI